MVIPQFGFGSTLKGTDAIYLLDKLDQLNIELGFNAYTTSIKGKLDVFCITLALMGWDRWVAPCYYSFFHRAESCGCPPLSWLRSFIYRYSLHNCASSGCVRAYEFYPYSPQYGL